MLLTELLRNEHVLLDIKVQTREACIDRLIVEMEKTGVVQDAAVYKQAVLKREEEGTTGIGFNIAIPHGKSNAVAKPGLAFARLEKGVDWNSMDGEPVQLVFLIAVPEEQAGNEHLQILSQLSRKLMHDDFRAKLKSAQTVNKLLDLLQ